MTTIHLGEGLDLPEKQAPTQTYGFIARKGAGKTYAAGRLVEELIRIGAPVIVIDPVGTWYGLGIAAGGKGPGLPIHVLGGEHGHLPLDVARGEDLARVVVERNLSAVIDVSSFRKNERKRFVTSFAERLFHEAKASRTPRVIVFEEAQVFAPQRSGAGDEMRMLGAIEDIVRLGRNYGLGSVLISQRPQSVNKEVLNQVELLCVGQLNGPQERKAIEQWVTDKDGDRAWLSELPKLPVGTMMCWSPQWLGILKKVKIAKKTTFDASATPELGGAKHKAPTMAAVDVDGLRTALEQLLPPKAAAKSPAPVKGPIHQQLEAGVEQVRAERHARTVAELAALEQRNRALESELRSARSSHRSNLQHVVTTARELWGELGAMLARAEQTIEVLQKELARSEPGHAGREGSRTDTRDPNGILTDRENLEALIPALRGKVSNGSAVPRPPPGLLFLNERQELPRTSTELRGGALRMLQAAATFYPGAMTRAQIARAAKMTTSGGTFGGYWSTLIKEALLEPADDGMYRATERGLLLLGSARPQVGDSFEDRLAFWCTRVKAGEARVLGEVVNHGPLTRAELAKRAQMAESGGTFGGYLGTLVSNKLIEKVAGNYRVHPWLLKGA